MINSFGDRNNEGRTSDHSGRENLAGNRKEQIVYTTDFDGAYHVEQDDELDDDLVSKES